MPSCVPLGPDLLYKPPVRVLLAFVALLFLGTFAPVRTTPPDPPPAVTLLTFTPLAEKQGERFGALRLLGAWNVESNDYRFGGISALHVEGSEALAVSDAGWRVRFPLPVGAARVRAELATLPDGPALGRGKADRDVESMAVLGDLVWLGLERRNAIVRFDRRGWSAERSAQPEAMREWRANRGGEAILRLPDGRFLLFSEGDGGRSEALLFLGDPAVAGTRVVPMRYDPPEGFRITDAAVLPDGRILYLNRRMNLFEGASAKLSVGRVPTAARAGTVLSGEEIAWLRRPAPVDNMEGLSVTREGGRTILWLMSDDNYNAIQRTLLLKLALEG